MEGLEIAAKHLEKVEEWNTEIESKLSEAEHELRRIKTWLEEAKTIDSRKERDKELEHERNLFEARLRFQAELQATKQQQVQREQNEGSKSSGAYTNCCVVKVRKSIEALPFTPEGYNRAKSILVDKYGKESEIVKAYSKEILELQAFSGVNVKKVHEFSDRLTYCVQSLETMGKLQQVSGYVSITLDKLPGIS